MESSSLFSEYMCTTSELFQYSFTTKESAIRLHKKQPISHYSPFCTSKIPIQRVLESITVFSIILSIVSHRGRRIECILYRTSIDVTLSGREFGCLGKMLVLVRKLITRFLKYHFSNLFGTGRWKTRNNYDRNARYGAVGRLSSLGKYCRYWTI